MRPSYRQQVVAVSGINERKSLCTRQAGKNLNKRGKRKRKVGREGGRERKEGERDVGYETYQISLFGGVALQNYKQQVATVPYNERQSPYAL